MNVAMLRCVYR